MLAPVNPMGCPRCVAERWVPRLNAAMMMAGVSSLNLLIALALVFSVLALLTRNERGRDATTFMGLLSDGVLFQVGLLALAIACAAGVLRILSRRLVRRASTPLPPPPADPLATYREGPPVECPRHPFAR